jgi:hypothetical protein
MRFRSFLILLAGAFFVSCGSDSMTGSQDPATIQGTVNASGVMTALSGPTVASKNAGIRVSIMGTSLSTTTDASGRFVLSGVTTDHVTLRFQATGIDATLDVSGIAPGQTLTISIRVSGNHAELDDDNDDNDNDNGPEGSQCFAVGQKAEVEGNITGKAASAITVAQQGKGSYDCQVTATTRIRHGNTTFTLDDLKVGDHVHVSGSGLGVVGGTCRVSADEIKLQ